MKKLLTKLCLTATLFTAPWAAAEADSFDLGTGRDGALRVDRPTLINRYAQVIAPLTAGDRSLQVDSLSGFEPGALVMVLQSTGLARELDSGQVAPLDLRQDAVGTFELARVQSASGGILTLTAPLMNTYAASVTQVVRVPEYTTVEVTASGVLQATPWNGRTGGVLAFLATQTVTNHGHIEATGAGFQGGTANPGGDDTLGCSSLDEVAPRGAQKGEGVSLPYLSGTGRGNEANAGGGGVCLMSGGGGGGHGGAGAQGGNSADGQDDAQSVSGLGRSVGGQGGVPLKYPLEKRLVFGGGGGAGHVGIAWMPVHSEGGDSHGQGHHEHGNGNGYGHCKGRGNGHDGEECTRKVGTGQDAGRGGGILFIRAGQLSGQGVISADGARGGNGVLSGGSGGGAGGIIHARFTGAATCGAMSANGGAGGSSDSACVPSGPGGGGGGGVIFFRAASASCPLSVTGGSAGTTPGAGATPSHGAGQAQDGQIDVRIDAPPDTEITSGPSDKTFETSATFDFQATEPDATFECSLDGADYEPCTSPLRRGDLRLGRHILLVRSIDEAGNVDLTPAQREWLIDLEREGEWRSHFQGSGCSTAGGGTPVLSLLLLVMTLIGARKR
jgi:uncharacterized protein (TIGR03382 family)